MIFKKNVLIFVFLGLSLILISVCSKLKKEMPTQPGADEVQLHAAGFLDIQSENFHGNYIRQHDWSMEECRKCHGADYTGGTSKSSCNLENCHPANPEACTTCHGGGDNQSGAPPQDINNNTETQFRGVGAHTAHLAASELSENEITCTTCHAVPQNLQSRGHIDGDDTAEIIWSDFVKKDNLNPAYVDSTCQNTYCHGASLTGGTLTAPVWTQSEPLECNSCHGQAPESGAHAAHLSHGEFDCNTCHEGYLKNSEVNKAKHINGVREVKLNATVSGNYANGVCSNTTCHGSGNSPNWTEDVTLGCTGCHGGVDNTTGAPPMDLSGNTAVANTGVGAHTAHISDPKWGRTFDCSECHIKPAEVNSAGHVDSNLPAEIVWGDLAKNEGQSPGWNGTTCSDVYCHGSSLSGASVPTPGWTDSGGLACDACHGLPPMTGAHEEHLNDLNLDCNACHQGYVKNSEVNEQQHIDGVRDVQLDAQIGGSYANGVCSDVRCHGSGGTPNWYDQASFTCVSCHGGLDNQSGAPPVDLAGISAAAARGVGAHTAHVSNSQWGGAYDCAECHIKPATIKAKGHVDLDPYAEINWGDFSKTGGLAPVWDGSDCSNVYCHGGTLQGGSNAQPQWNTGARLTCDACHGLPPGTGAHSAHTENYDIDCNVCHDGYSKNSTVSQELHIDGKYDVQLSAETGGTYSNGVCSNVACHGVGNTPNWNADIIALACTECHGGGDNNTGAPPADLAGNTATTETGVGAHTMHVTGSQWAQAFDCRECHSKPDQISDPGHIALDLQAEIEWGALSRTDALSPDWNGASCTNIYCHGASLSGGRLASSNWTRPADVNCASCHGLPPETGAHDEHVLEYNYDCSICHNGYEISRITVDKAVHINGNRDVQFDEEIGGTYSSGVCSNVLCHGGGNTPNWYDQAELNCRSCHGGMDNESGAPPLDLMGHSETTFKGVGAHSIHITGGDLSDGMDCTECHKKPTETSDAGHIGMELLPAEINWGILATMDDAVPSWDGAQYCANVYCHGEFSSGNQQNSPSWIIVDGSQAACGSCHGLPPAEGHPQNENCHICHGSVVDSEKNIIAKDLHINGRTDYN